MRKIIAVCSIFLMSCSSPIYLDCAENTLPGEYIPVCNATLMQVQAFDLRNAELNCGLSNNIIPYASQSTSCRLDEALVHWYDLRTAMTCNVLQDFAQDDYCF